MRWAKWSWIWTWCGTYLELFYHKSSIHPCDYLLAIRRCKDEASAAGLRWHHVFNETIPAIRSKKPIWLHFRIVRLPKWSAPNLNSWGKPTESTLWSHCSTSSSCQCIWSTSQWSIACHSTTTLILPSWTRVSGGSQTLAPLTRLEFCRWLEALSVWWTSWRPLRLTQVQ
jgi:hypothetical protein